MYASSLSGFTKSLQSPRLLVAVQLVSYDLACLTVWCHAESFAGKRLHGPVVLVYLRSSRMASQPLKSHRIGFNLVEGYSSLS